MGTSPSTRAPGRHMHASTAFLRRALVAALALHQPESIPRCTTGSGAPVPTHHTVAPHGPQAPTAPKLAPPDDLKTACPRYGLRICASATAQWHYRWLEDHAASTVAGTAAGLQVADARHARYTSQQHTCDGRPHDPPHSYGYGRLCGMGPARPRARTYHTAVN